MLYIWQHLPSIYPSHVSIYTSTMDPMGIEWNLCIRVVKFHHGQTKKTSPDSSPGIIGHQGAQKGNLPDSSVTFAGYRAANPKKCEILFAFDFKLRYFKWKNEQGCFQHPRLPQNIVLFVSTQKWDGATLMKKVYKNHQGNLALCSKPPTKGLKSWSLQTHVQNKYRPSPQPLGKHQVGILTSVVMPKLT